jgi:flagellar basal-body rod protein FlgC
MSFIVPSSAQAPPKCPPNVYVPAHPDAGAHGCVSYADINPLTEPVDLMGATRAYTLSGAAG